MNYKIFRCGRRDLKGPGHRINRLVAAVYPVHTFGGRGSPSL
jgi:hypothetical protein